MMLGRLVGIVRGTSQSLQKIKEGQCEESSESSERMMWDVAGGGSGVRSGKD